MRSAWGHDDCVSVSNRAADKCSGTVTQLECRSMCHPKNRCAPSLCLAQMPIRHILGARIGSCCRVAAELLCRRTFHPGTSRCAQVGLGGPELGDKSLPAVRGNVKQQGELRLGWASRTACAILDKETEPLVERVLWSCEIMQSRDT